MPAQVLPALSSKSKGDHPFLASKKGNYTYGDLQEFETYIVDLLAQKACNTSPVGIWANSSDLTIFLIATCWKQNIPFICLNPEAKKGTLRQQIDALQPAIIFSGTPTLMQKIENAVSIEILPDLSTILNNGDDKISNVPSYSTATVFGYFFTSGTSDIPKIVPLKRRQMHVAATASARNIKPAINHFWMLCMPLHHVGGVSLILRSLLYGSAIYRLDTFNAEEVKNYLANDKRFSVASLVPTMLKRLLDDTSFKTHPQFDAILLGGGPISPVLLHESVRRRIPVIPSYGMTETCAQIAANPIMQNEMNPHFKSAGKIFEPNHIEIRDKDGAVLPHLTSGSIWLKGPQIFDGYLHQRAGQPTINKNGWFNTGDFGRLNEHNHLYVEARRTDLIVTGGENVSPFEIERALEAISAVKEAAVFGAPDKEWGQRIVAVIVPDQFGKVSTSILTNALQKTVPGWKIPKQFIFTNTLPRTHTGKVRRAKLKDFLT